MTDPYKSVIPSASRPVEEIVKKGMKPSEQKKKVRELRYLQKESNAKNFENWVKTRIQLASLNEDKETEIILNSVLSKYREFKRDQKENVVIEVKGWKGKDAIEIYKGFTNNFTILEHRKDKETGEVETATHEVSNEDVNRLLFFIKKWEIGETRKCYDFAEALGLPNWQEIWRKRTKVYFKLYYFPIKCLEAMKIINYSGRGTITRLI